MSREACASRSSLRRASLLFAVPWLLAQGACASHSGAAPHPAESHPMPQTAPTVEEDIEAKTRGLLAAAAAGDFDRASRDFGDVMKQALPPARYAETWRALDAKVGKLQSVDGVQLEQERGLWVSLADARFERDRLLVKVVYDARHQVVGLFFLPPRVPWSAPSYASPQAFEEKPVTVGVDPALAGVLTRPRGAGPFPGVVLVHGSGPSDADESVGAIKVFKDLAWGLASRGIAVLRYTKRTLQSPAGVVTQKEEVLDAARDAVALLRRTDGIRLDRVFVLGHSQGGGLAPRIAEASPGLAGIVVLAGPTRPLEDLLVEQYAYLASLDQGDAVLAAKIEEARRFKRVVEDPRLRPDQELTLPTGSHLTGAYFLDVRGYDPAAVARTLPCRILVLQGERDYQVTSKDFERWKTVLAGKDGAAVRAYPSLNHLFVSGSGAPSPEEYEHAGHVDEAVVSDIAAWLLGGT